MTPLSALPPRDRSPELEKNRQYIQPQLRMAGKKGAGENSKKAAGQARKAEAAAQKAAAENAKKEAVEDAEWQKGSKSNAKK